MTAFLFMVSSYAGWTLFAAVSRLTALAGFDPKGVSTVPGFFGSLAGFFSTCIGFSLLHFALAFPDASCSRLSRNFLRAFGWMTFLLGLTCFSPWWISARHMEDGAMVTSKGILFYLTSGWSFLLIFSGVLILFHRQRHETRPVYRTQMRYCLAAMVPAVLSAFVFSFALPWVSPHFQRLFTVGPSAGIAFTLILFAAIVKNRLFDMATLIHRSILMLALAAVGSISAFSVSDLFTRYKYNVSIPELTVLYFFLFLFAYMFLRNVQPWMETRFFGRLHRPEQLIERVLDSVKMVDRDVFSACKEAAEILRRELRVNRVVVTVPSASSYRCASASSEGDALLLARLVAQINRHPRMLRTLAEFVTHRSPDFSFESILPAGVGSPEDRSFRVAAGVRDFFVNAGFEAVFPVLYGRQVMAVFVLGRKDSGTPYFSEEHAALRSLGQALGVSLKNLHDFNSLLREETALEPAIAREGRTIVLGEGRELVFLSSAMERSVNAAQKAALNSENVMLLGETGSGKELLARLIHAQSQRGGPLVALNCAALAESLLENELFGHEKGAYTGADRSTAGLLEQAHGGTLFLDEIGEISSALQAKLLRVLEERHVRRIGGQQTRPIDIRLITATHRNLKSLVEAGSFRADLYYRLNVVVIEIPPLRDRREDIAPIAEQFLIRLRLRLGRPELQLSLQAQQVLVRASWPGNVRELQNALTRAAVSSETGILGAQDFPDAGVKTGSVSAVIGGIARSPGEPLDRFMERVETVLLQDALGRSRGNKAEAARDLGMNRTTFYYKLGLIQTGSKKT